MSEQLNDDDWLHNATTQYSVGSSDECDLVRVFDSDVHVTCGSGGSDGQLMDPSDVLRMPPVCMCPLVVVGATIRIANTNMRSVVCVASHGQLHATGCVFARSLNDSPEDKVVMLSVADQCYAEISDCRFANIHYPYELGFISIAESSMVVFDRVGFSDIGDSLYVERHSAAVFNECTFTDCDYAAIVADRTSKCRMRRCRFVRCDLCISADRKSTVLLDECVFEDCGECVCADRGSSVDAVRCRFGGLGELPLLTAKDESVLRMADCSIQRGGDGVVCDDGRARMHACAFSNISGKAVHAYGRLANCVMTGCTMQDVGECGAAADSMACLALTSCALGDPRTAVRSGYGCCIAVIGCSTDRGPAWPDTMFSQMLVCDTRQSAARQPCVIDVLDQESYAADPYFECEEDMAEDLVSVAAPCVSGLFESQEGIQFEGAFGFKTLRLSLMTGFETGLSDMVPCVRCGRVVGIAAASFSCDSLQTMCDGCARASPTNQREYRQGEPPAGACGTFIKADAAWMCTMCGRKRACVLFSPCGHVDLCAQCYYVYRRSFRQCPRCGQPQSRAAIVPYIPKAFLGSAK